MFLQQLLVGPEPAVISRILPDKPVPRAFEKAQCRLVTIDIVTLGVDHQYGTCDPFKKCAIAFFAFPKRLFAPPALGDVTANTPEADYITTLVPYEKGRGLAKAMTPISANDTAGVVDQRLAGLVYAIVGFEDILSLFFSRGKDLVAQAGCLFARTAQETHHRIVGKDQIARQVKLEVAVASFLEDGAVSLFRLP